MVHMARSAALLAMALAAVAPIGCGPTDAPEPSASPSPPMTSARFPSPRGRSLDEIRRGLGPGLALAPGTAVLEPGRERFAFAMFDRARRQVAEAPAALYVAPEDGKGVRGPFMARHESLVVKPQYRSRSVATDPDAARSVYVASLPFRRPGSYRVMSLVRLDDRLVATDPLKVRVTRSSPVPAVGEPAPRVSTPTIASVGGALDLIETRDPPDSMHDTDFADVVGRRPVVILFSTPALCKSRVCGPVNDVAEQVKAEHSGEAAFIHVEIYEGNRTDGGLRPQVKAWHLPTEPWAFTVGRDGRVAARLEGAFSPGELEAALKRATER